MLKSSTLALSTLGFANASKRQSFLAQSQSADTCWRAINVIEGQAGLRDQWASLTNWVDEDFDVRDKNSHAYWYPENG